MPKHKSLFHSLNNSWSIVHKSLAKCQYNASNVGATDNISYYLVDFLLWYVWISYEDENALQAAPATIGSISVVTSAGSICSGRWLW